MRYIILNENLSHSISSWKYDILKIIKNTLHTKDISEIDKMYESLKYDDEGQSLIDEIKRELREDDPNTNVLSQAKKELTYVIQKINRNNSGGDNNGIE